MRLVVTGDGFFLARYAPMLRALEKHLGPVTPLASGNLAEWMPLRLYNKVTRGTALHNTLFRREPSPTAFAIRSRQTGRKLARLNPPPDLVLHVFGTFAPRHPHVGGPPYVLYLDYTMAQARREYPPWASFSSDRACQRWMELEGRTYRQARHVFAMSGAVKAALISDYAVAADRISVIASGGHFDQVYEGPRTFGTKRILFDGSAFERKGGDILVDAMAQLRRTIDTATLVVIGGRIETAVDGVVNPGAIHDRKILRDMFLSADVVVSATRCDPFPGFIIEALNFGVPCVVSRQNGLAGVILERGAGLVVDDSTPDAYAAALGSLLDAPDRLARMSENARRVVREQLNWQAVAAMMAPTLRACAAPAPAGL